jgi:hypothetical protein
MTLASAGEGIARLLMNSDDKYPEFDKSAIKEFQSYIQTWPGNAELRERILGWFPLLGEKSVSRYLRSLVSQGVLDARHERAWSRVRNAVMHGNLVSPWPTKDEDEQISSLADLVHLLTIELTSRVDISVRAGTQTSSAQ